MSLRPYTQINARTSSVLELRSDELSGQVAAARERGMLYRDLDEPSGPALRSALAGKTPHGVYLPALLDSRSEDVLQDLLDAVDLLEETSPGIANEISTARVGIVCDLFLYRSFEGLIDLVPLFPDTFRDEEDLDVLLITSTWRGIDGESWSGVAQEKGELRRVLLDELIPHFRSRGVPVVFYSKEDPPNYGQFLEFAQQADYIFTTAAEKVADYQRDCPQATTVEVLPFGINPLHHSPIGSRLVDTRLITFAGSWFNHKYAERSQWGRQLLDGVNTAHGYELLIFDRNSRLGLEKYAFPGHLLNKVHPAIDHRFLLDVQRLSDIAINLNSVSFSSTMMANRAIELQAQNTAVLSNYNARLNSRYPHVHLANSADDVRGFLETMTMAELRRMQADGLRAVFSNELASSRLRSILRAVGHEVTGQDLRVGIVLEGRDRRLEQQVEAQTLPAVVIPPGLDGSHGSAAGTGRDVDVLVRMGPGFDYEPTHVEDLVNAFRYTSATSVEKIPVPGVRADRRAHRYHPVIDEPLCSAQFVGAPRNATVVREAYALDDVGVRPRTSPDPVVVSGPRRPLLSVIVPVYDNGGHLQHKCFASLRRSAVFGDMEVILVDDGSTDPQTVSTVRRLEREYPQVRVHRFPPGGSGSASRPRNKGLEMARGEYVTYLDPDNEAVNDGYARLVGALQRHPDADFAIGNMTRWRQGHRLARYARTITNRLPLVDGVVTLDDRSLVELGFQPMSIQAIVARRAWLAGLDLIQPVGALGQDSYFFQQMLYYARRIVPVDLPVHTYYGEVENSMVNSVSANFFRKYVPLERARSAWLREVGLLEEYKEARVEVFLKHWYLRKLRLVDSSQIVESKDLIEKLVGYYGDHPTWTDSEVVDFWQERSQGGVKGTLRA